MAKLNVVVPAVDVEIDGAKYRKVDRTVREGDIIKVTDNDGRDYVIEGGFYEVDCDDRSDGTIRIYDEDGDGCWLDEGEYEVYEKVAETVAQQYREVKRPAKVGEQIKIINASSFSDYQNGDVFEVIGDAGNNDVFIIDTAGDKEGVWYSEYVVLEPIQPALPKRLTVGDYAKVIADSAGKYEVGSIIRITQDDCDSAPYVGVYADGTGPNAYLCETEVVPATEAEFLAQSRLKVGDFVKVVDASGCGAAKLGDIAEVVAVEAGLISYGPMIEAKTIDGRTLRMFASRYVRATEAEVEAAKEALRYGDFTDGDYAQVVNATNANSTVTVQGNGGKYGKVTRHQYGGYGLKFTLEDGEYGSCKPDALRKVTREEYEAAVDPRNQFAKGDKVRLVSGGGEFPLLGFTNGDIYEVDVPRYVGHPSRNGVIKIKTAASKAGFATPDQLEKVSAEEVAEIEKWAAIGRKVGEFKRGDVVEVLESGSSGYTVGLVDTVDTVNNRSVTLSTGRRRPHIAVSRVKLIVPVEQRFDAA